MCFVGAAFDAGRPKQHAAVVWTAAPEAPQKLLRSPPPIEDRTRDLAGVATAVETSDLPADLAVPLITSAMAGDCKQLRVALDAAHARAATSEQLPGIESTIDRICR
jgi:hypothetical protein